MLIAATAVLMFVFGFACGWLFGGRMAVEGMADAMIKHPSGYG